MRRTGRWLLVAGGTVCALTLLVFIRTNAANDELAVIDTTPYFVWAAIGAVVLILGAVFFAAGEVVRALGPPEPAPSRPVGSRSHFE